MESKLLNGFKKKKVLITGGMGFIGSNLARQLQTYEAQVTIVDNPGNYFAGERYNLHGIEDEVQVVFADMCDVSKVGKILPQQDYLFNMAAQVSHIGSMKDPKTDVQSNVLDQISLLEMCRAFNPTIRIVYGSTRQIYGRPQYLPVDESHPLEPVDFNGISKLAGERYHRLCHQLYNTQITSLRMTNVYGPRMRIQDGNKSFIGLWFRQLINGQDITIFGDGHQLRDINYVNDVVDALLLCATSPQAVGQVYNIGAEPISLLALAKLMIEINGSGKYRFYPFPEERKKIDIGNYFTNFQKIKDQLGWRPVTELKKGVVETLNYYREHLEKYVS